ncbi:hypothetical protein PSEUDO8O_150063 [Pseudomonas sp. 8O]|nr:hypothetical protein PSEUDO8O_150063 [Pseudomonas sp. 8O]
MARGESITALNCRSLRSLGSQKLRFCLLVGLIVIIEKKTHEAHTSWKCRLRKEHAL